MTDTRFDRAPALIVGAGVGGLTAALALARHGMPVAVYERREQREITMAGSGLTIWSNATTMLAALGLGAELAARSAPILRGESVDAQERVIYRMQTARYTWRAGAPSVSIGRGDLVEMLMTACERAGVPVHLGRRCIGFDQSPGGVTLKLGDGEAVEGSVLIGADGIRSAVLATLHDGLPEPTYTGRSTYRGICPSSAGLEPGVVYMFQHAATNVGGGAWHVGGGRVAWTLSTETPPEGRDAPGTLKDRATELARPLPGLPSRLVAGTASDAVIRTDIFFHEWREDWGAERVTLVGDAAHAMPTVLGQGACQAIEDAVVLADSLVSIDDPVAALRDYERRRVGRVKWVRDQVFRHVRWPRIGNPVLRWVVTHAVAPVVVAISQRRMWRGLQRPPRLRVAHTKGVVR